jgi:hypothetical protein
MDPQPAVGLRDLLTHVVGDIAKALCRREGETQQQRYDRTQAVAHTVMAFTPRDAIEAMLAGHCVMFHEMIVDSVHSTMGGEVMAKRRTTRGNIVAMDKAFGNNLDRLERYQSRQAQGAADARPAQDRAEAELTDRVQRHQSRTPPSEPGKQAVPAPAGDAPVGQAPVGQAPVGQAPMGQAPVGQAPVGQAVTEEAPVGHAATGKAPAGAASAVRFPSPEAIAACLANPEAMAALDAGDPARFAAALGVEQPSDAYLAAASDQMAVFSRLATVSRVHPANGEHGRSRRQANP